MCSARARAGAEHSMMCFLYRRLQHIFCRISVLFVVVVVAVVVVAVVVLVLVLFVLATHLIVAFLWTLKTVT